MTTDYQAFTEALAEIERGTEATLEALLRLLLQDDAAMYEHVHRVAQLSTAVALLCGAREPQVSIVEWAALLHHAAAPPGDGAAAGRGLDLVRAAPAFAASVGMVEAVQRYREGAVENRAPLELGVRIIAMCDRFDELTRSGRDAVSADEALAILVGERAGGYGGDALDALCAVTGRGRTAQAATSAEALGRAAA